MTSGPAASLVDTNILVYALDPRYPLTPDVTGGAIRGVEQYQLAWWDALVWATAVVNGIPVVLSEDFNPGAVLDGVRFVNPLDPAFALASL